MIITIYKTAIGKIDRVVDCPESLVSAQVQTGEAYIGETSNDATQYVLNDVITDRPTMGVTLNKTTITANTIDTATISSVPLGVEVFINNVLTGICDDGTVEVTADLPGELIVKLSLFPYLDYEVTIDAN